MRRVREPLTALALLVATLVPASATAQSAAAGAVATQAIVEGFESLDAAVATGDERWAIVHAESVASFRVRVLGILPIGGEFARFDGAIVLDRARSRARVEATIRADSVTMANPAHADWARSPEFFDAVAHPEIRFVSKPIRFATIAAGGTLRGALTLRGITHEVSFALESSDGCDLATATKCTVTVAGSVARSVFGMVTRPRTLNDRVSLRFTITAAATAAPK